MRIQVAIPEAHVDKPVLNAALESVTRLNEAMLKNGEVIPFDRAVKTHGIRWAPEPPGQEHFDHAKTVLVRGWGDCDDLAPWQAASLRHSGEDPAAQAVVYRSGPQRWHAVVKRGNGQIDDPSKRAGMPTKKNPGSRPAAGPLLATGSDVGSYLLRPQIAVRPVYGQFQARADLPWNWREKALLKTPDRTDWAMTSLHTAPVASTALTGAINGLVKLAGAAGAGDEDHINRLCCISDYINGVEPDELAEVYGDEHLHAAQAVVGSFWKRLGRIAKKALPVASRAVSFIPGVGPIASSAIDLARTAIPTGGGMRAAAPPTPITPAAEVPAGGGGTKRRVCLPLEFY